MVTKLSSGSNEVIWLDPALIEHKISPCHDLKGKVGGDWDIERRYQLDRSAKYRAIFERYVEGRKWEETDLFLDAYAYRFEKGMGVRGTDTFPELLEQYYTRVDGMFRNLKENGFRLHDERGRKYPLPGLLIGRNGEVFLNNQGNHRVAMAKVIGLDRIAGEVICRHKLAPKDCLSFLQ